MAVPKKKTSTSRRDKRRAHDALKPINVSFDKNTGEAKLPHHISLKDGMYNGKQILIKREKPTEDSASEAAEA
ncbi:50S ribosomal protein L32 [endosymbiont of Acanthamoeba sp. UWC8]|nr:50S ribosomal protein L32 [Candidatus Jidaibacter acanthamoeba]AIF81556.1 50S ribosomal protein L32 [endosymbiont of Acanthamoeba sp. UWC8]MBA8666847.1 50S ribosomal protein L32 [Holosporaceae bacterium 'Namur']